MGFWYQQMLRPILFRKDPETAHEEAVRVIGTLGASGPFCRLMEQWNRLGRRFRPIEVFGVKFPNAVGLAAGFDKNAVCWSGLAALGFGHVEIGTVTARRQPGNPRPRLFRYPGEEALINRMGFNNDGAERVARRLAAGGRKRGRIPLGINIGKSRAVSLEEAAEDYRHAFDTLADYADYVTINVSSPNTPDLRRLQEESLLVTLLNAMREANVARVREAYKPRVPILVKIAPDLSYRQIDAIVETVLDLGLDGIIAVNTTLKRPGALAGVMEAGGVSGAPLRRQATDIIRYIHLRTEGRLPLIGVGGIDDPDSAGEKMDAGASLIQIYTGMVYRGPFLARDLARALSHRQREGWV